MFSERRREAMLVRVVTLAAMVAGTGALRQVCPNIDREFCAALSQPKPPKATLPTSRQTGPYIN
jgi:hypothetical protein